MSTLVAFFCLKVWLIMVKIRKNIHSLKKKKNQTTWNVDTFQRVSLYTHRMPNQLPLREFWLIKQALCAGINNAVAMWELWCAQRPAVSLMHAVNALITQVKTTALGAVDRPLFRDVGSKNWAPVLLISDTHQICPERPQARCWVIQQRTKWIQTMKAFKCDTLNTVFYTYFSQHHRLSVNVSQYFNLNLAVVKH